MFLPKVVETIIFDYTVSLRVFELQSRLLDLVFAINGSVSCINTLLLGFCLTPHDSPDYGLICFEYILESLENLLDGRGILFGLENQNIENVRIHLTLSNPLANLFEILLDHIRYLNQRLFL